MRRRNRGKRDGTLWTKRAMSIITEKAVPHLRHHHRRARRSARLLHVTRHSKAHTVVVKSILKPTANNLTSLKAVCGAAERCTSVAIACARVVCLRRLHLLRGCAALHGTPPTLCVLVGRVFGHTIFASRGQFHLRESVSLFCVFCATKITIAISRFLTLAVQPMHQNKSTICFSTGQQVAINLTVLS